MAMPGWSDADTKTWMQMATDKPRLRKVRNFILLGMGGAPTSMGMYNLVEPLKEFGETTVHNWENAAEVVNAINSMPPDEPATVAAFNKLAIGTEFITDYEKWL